MGSVPHGSASPPGNLPLELTSFVGREGEIAEARRRLGETHLLTLTGPGGSGKTRLALELATDVGAGFEDGVWWAGLAPLSDPDLFPQTVADALGIRGEPARPLPETLEDHLRSRRALLVLDNCEHLVDGCAALVDALLHACPGLRVLATSREVLGVDGEISYPVPPLSLPSLQDVHSPARRADSVPCGGALPVA